MKQSDFDMITLDLRMDGAFIKENMVIKWTAETGFVENIQKLVKEYKQSRNLIVKTKKNYYLNFKFSYRID